MLKRMVLSPPELRRYSRHLKLAEIGVAGQVGVGTPHDFDHRSDHVRADGAQRAQVIGPQHGAPDDAARELPAEIRAAFWALR